MPCCYWGSVMTRHVLSIFFAIFAVLCPIGPSYAQSSNTCSTSNDGCTEGRAYNQCLAAVAYTMTLSVGSIVYDNCTKSGTFQFTCGVKPKDSTANMCRNASGAGQTVFFFVRSCIAMEGLPPGLIIFDGHDKSEICAGGCKFKRGDAPTDNFDIEGFARTVGMVGGWTPTGAVCSDNEPPPKSEPQCIAGAGQTLCIKPNGEKCATASNGTTFCWGKGDSGDKTDGNEFGTNSDNGPKAPNNPPKPPDGTDWKPPQNCTTVTERNPFSYSSTTRTVCTGTSTGNPNPPACDPTRIGANCQRPTDNLNGCDPKTDPKQCQGGTASGGQGCDSAPTCSGDPIGCAILGQSWRQRCSPNGNKAKGGSCNTDGTIAALDCSGDEIACRHTQAALEMKCKAQADGNALRADAGDGIDENEDPGDFFIDPPSGGPGSLFNTNLISMGGGNLLPSVTLAGQTWQPPPILYDILAAIRWLVIAGCTVFAMRIRVGL
jgi:hypothetical protein